LELMRLRNEVTQLKASAAAAREAVKEALENRQGGVQQVAMIDEQGRSMGETKFRKEEWGFRGYGTPEDTLVSGMWALTSGDLEKVVEGLTVGEREQWQARAVGKTEEEIKAGILREYGNVAAMKITEERQVSPKEVVLTVTMEGPGQMTTREMGFQLEGNEWKMQSLVNTYDPLAFYRRNPELMRRYFPHLFRGEVNQQQGAPEGEETSTQSSTATAGQQNLPPELMRRYGLNLQQQPAPAHSRAAAEGHGSLPPEPSPNE
jgi:hypothetical protein